MPDPQSATLASMVRAKYPGVYDDLSDQDLEAKVTAKFPGVYDDIPKTPASGGGMNFAIVNGQRVPVPDDGPLDLVTGAASALNPLPAIKQAGQVAQSALLATGAHLIGRDDLAATAEQPIRSMAHDVLEAQNHVKAQADDAWSKGDHATAVRKYIDWLLPVIGPAIDSAADKMQHGQPWRGAGEAIGMGLGLALPKAVETAGVKVPGVGGNRNAIEAGAVQFGEEHGVPIDAATATGNPFIRNIQKGTANTLLGAPPAMRTQAAQASALTRVGQELADQAHPYPQTPELAGEQLRAALQQKVTDLHGAANTAYGTVRDIEQEPGNAVEVPKPKSADDLAFSRAIDERAKVSAGRSVTPEEWSELRRIREELDSMPYQQGGTIQNANRNQAKAGVTGSDASPYVQGSGGAPVYHDILQLAPGTSKMTRSEVLRSIDRALADGTFTNAAKGALAVAEERLKGGRGVSGAILPPGYGSVPDATVPMQMPVNVSAVKKMLRPIYDQMTRQLPITMQRASPGLKAISNVLDGPDYAPLSQVDQDLSAIKALGRGSDLPELKSMSQGLAAQAVKRLETEVQNTMQRASVRGDEAATALRAGRDATAQKYGVAGELKDLRDEPVQAFQQTVYANDAGVDRLRRIGAIVPDELPKIGRAWLDQALTRATSEGGFAHAQRMQTDWQKLGPQTKALLFDKPGQVQALDHYFRLARMIAENPNPSGTAMVGTSLASLQGLFYAPIATVTGNLATGGISAILQSPKAVQLFTKGARLTLGPGKTSTAARSMGIANILQAAREAGLRSQPEAAGDREPVRPGEQPR